MNDFREWIVSRVVNLLSEKTFYFVAGVVLLSLGVTEHLKERKRKREEENDRQKEDDPSVIVVDENGEVIKEGGSYAKN